mgnify:FL=1
MKVLSIIRFAIRQENFRHSFKASELNRFSTSEYHKHFKIGTMRKLLVLLAFPLLVLSACSETTKEEIADLLIISQDNVAFPMEGGQATISVACPSQWSSTVSDPSWITATDGDGNVTITVTANETGDSRKASVILESATTKKEIMVSQSWSGAVLSLKINGPENMELDSEGDSFKFSVETNAEWKVESSAAWLTTSSEENLVSVTAAANSEAHRDAAVTITATVDGKSEIKEINVSQISREENPYFQMLGSYGLYAERWYYGGNAINVPGIGSYCTIEQKEYGKTFTIKNLFVEGTEYEASYDKETKRMVLTLGSLCLTRTLVQSQQTYYYYMVQPNIMERKFETGILYGTIGTATDGKSENCQAILLDGFDEAYGSLGLIVRVGASQSMAMLSDVYYADGKMYFVRAEKETLD